MRCSPGASSELGRGWGLNWQSAIALGGALAMSSTAIVVKLMAERLELETEHGRRVMGVLLFQDLAVVPLLVLIPALGASPEVLVRELALATLKAGALLTVLLVGGPLGHALVADAGGAPQERGALHPQPAAGDARPGLAHRDGGPLARARRLRRRHADRRDRVQAPGRNRHPAVPRRPARALLHHHRHEARRHRGLARMGARAAADDRAGALQVRRSSPAWPASSARRPASRCAPASTSPRRASSASCC